MKDMKTKLYDVDSNTGFVEKFEETFTTKCGQSIDYVEIKDYRNNVTQLATVCLNSPEMFKINKKILSEKLKINLAHLGNIHYI